MLSARWVEDGLISRGQREHILASTAAPDDVEARLPGEGRNGRGLAVEALGYVGGVVVVVAGLMLGSQVWVNLGTAARVLLVGGAALGLGAAGAAVPSRAGDVGIRLRSVLWLAATAATAGFLAVLGTDVLALDNPWPLAAVGATVAATAAWVVHRTLLQQAVMMIAAMLAAAATISETAVNESLPGLGVWCLGVTWALLAWGGVLAHRRAGLALGAAAAMLGAMTTIPDDAGTVLALVTTFGVVGVAVWFRDLVLLAVGALGTFNALPAAVSTWWPDTLAAPIGLLVVGLALVMVALYVSRRSGQPRTVRRDWSCGTSRTAWMLATPVLTLLVGVFVTTALA